MTSLFAVNVTKVPLTGGNVLTLLQVQAPTSKSLRVARWGVSFDGTDVTNTPVRVELARQTTGSSGNASTYSPVPWDEPSTDQGLATALTTFTTEPGGGAILETHYVSPAGGNLIEAYAIDSIEMPKVAPGSRIAIRVLAGAVVNANAFLVFAE